MSSNEEIICKTLDKLKQLSEGINKRCTEISKSSISAITLSNKLLKLCARIRKNCDVFENDLRSLFPNNETPYENDELLITLNLLDIIGEENCKNLKNNEFSKLKVKLEQVTKDYLTDLRDPIFENLYELHYSTSTNSNNANLESTRISADLNLPSSSNVSAISLQSNHDPSKNTEISSTKSQDEILPSTDQSQETEVNQIECGNNILETTGSKNLSSTEQQSPNLQQTSDVICPKSPETGNESAELTLKSSSVNVENLLISDSEKLEQLEIASSQNCSEKEKSQEEIEKTQESEHIDSSNINLSQSTQNVQEEIEKTQESEHIDSSNINVSQSTQNVSQSTEIVQEGIEKTQENEHIDSSNINVSQSTQNLEDKNADELVSTQEAVVGSDQISESSYEINAKKNEFLSNLCLEKNPKQDNHENIKTIRDELMEIFAEIACQEDENGQMKEIGDSHDSSSDSSDDEDKYGATQVAAALKELEEDSSDIESVSDSEIDLSSLDMDSYLDDEEPGKDESEELNNSMKSTTSINNLTPKKCYVYVEKKNLEQVQKELSQSIKSSEEPSTTDENITDIEENTSSSLTKECSVVLERLDVRKQNSELDSGTQSDHEDAEINRLCQLSNLENSSKRRRTSEETVPKRKIKRKRRCEDLSGTETTDLSGYSSVSEDEIKKERIFEDNRDNDDTVPLDPNALLAEIICHTIHDSDSDSDSSTILSSEEEKKREHKKRNTTKTVSQSKEVPDNEKQESWKDDPLLRGSLNVPSDKKNLNVPPSEESLNEEKILKRIGYSDTECERKKKIKLTKTRRKYLDPNYSESNSSSDDFEDVEMNQKGDSDIEYIGSTSSNGSIIKVDSDDEINKKNSRRNIKSVLSTKSLTESTQKAAKEEEARVIRLEEQKFLRSSQESEVAEDSIILDVSSDGSRITVDPNLSKKLFTHQIEGVKFMWDACYLSIDSLESFNGTGCILAHNMGLGKTLQVVTLVHTLFSYPITKTKHVLIVCPLSTVTGWKREFLQALKIVENTKDIKIFTVESKYDRKSKCFIVNQWKKTRGVLILGYEAFSILTRDDSAMREALVNPGPDLVVCDEGHLLKNGNAARTRALMQIRTKRRIALTGTPLQNNLKEYYFMVQFVKPNLLGTKLEFNRQFTNPIMNGQYEDSLEHDITLMKKRTHVLHRLLKNTVQRYEATELHKYLENMKDYALFIQLHPIQEKLYRKYIETVAKKRMANDKDNNAKKDYNSFFVDYQILKYICSHPQLLQTMETQNVQRNKIAIKEKEVISEEPEIHEVEGLTEDWWKGDFSNEIQTNIEFGTKLQVMMGIIEEAEKIGEKVLIFTSSLVELSSVEYFLKLKGTPQCSSWKPKRDYFRMDGTVKPALRSDMCDMFNDESNKTLRVFLMSHKVGGLGLNLVAANRIILLGANFNPSLDSQSIYRAYRFGQHKKVYIYRLLSMGTMEEKIYHRCITKLAIASRVVDKHQIARHYKNLDLEDLYNVDINLSVQRITPPKPEDDILSSILLRFNCVHKYIQHQKLLENRPDEELNEEDQKKAWEEFKQMNEKERNITQGPTQPNIASLVQNKWNQLNISTQSKPSEQTSTAWKNIPSSMRMNPLTHQYQQVTSNFVTNKPSLPSPKKVIQESSLKNNTMSQSTGRPTSQTKSSNANVANYPHGNPPRLIPLTKENYKNYKKSTANTTTKGSTVAPINKDPSILQNVSVNSEATQNNKSAKEKFSTIGPNPVLMRKFPQRKVNEATVNSRRTPWRWSSSEDFQKTGNSKVFPSKRKIQPKNIKQHAPTEVTVIDISEENSHSKDPTSFKEVMKQKIEKQLDDLRKRNLTVTATSTTKEQIPYVIDIT